MQFLVIGAGAWGTAVACLLAKNGQTVQIWSHNPEHLHQLQQARENRRYLPQVIFPPNLMIASSLKDAVAEASDILLAVPSQYFLQTLQLLQTCVSGTKRLVWVTKGLVPNSEQLLHELVQQYLLLQDMAVIAGPNFAREVAAGLPAATTIAASSESYAHELARALHNERFQVYTSSDLIGVEVAGAVKNIIAIATGIADGLDFGANARAALITSGLAEMTRIGIALGALAETFTGPAGIGDLVLTCTDNQSRNRRFGLALATHKCASEAQLAIGQLVEGLHNAKDVYHLAQRHGVAMPITEQIYKLLYADLPLQQAAANLVATPNTQQWSSV